MESLNYKYLTLVILLYIAFNHIYSQPITQGKILLTVDKPVQSIDVSHLNAGVYFIRFESWWMKKFVKE